MVTLTQERRRPAAPRGPAPAAAAPVFDDDESRLAAVRLPVGDQPGHQLVGPLTVVQQDQDRLLRRAQDRGGKILKLQTSG